MSRFWGIEGAAAPFFIVTRRLAGVLFFRGGVLIFVVVVAAAVSRCGVIRYYQYYSLDFVASRRGKKLLSPCRHISATHVPWWEGGTR